ncbi:MAG: hypothetical protein KC615_20745 [Anaerolineae bacterium]|nr:hypothetical protein [Anaerolineae bacterium]MCA9895431.1 hypothetical protein [Anaerolineae bacterium]
MAQAATMQELMLAAAEGAAEGVTIIRDADIAVELEEFEIEVTYSAETELKSESEGKLSFNFLISKGSYTKRTSRRNTTTYGLKVRFLFSGAEPEEEA